MANMTPEERAAEKLRRKQLEMEADTKLGLDSLGLGGDAGAVAPTQELAKNLEAITKQVRTHNQDEIFPELENFVKTLCAGCKILNEYTVHCDAESSFSLVVSSINIRKIRSSLDNLYLEKQKIEKGDKPKKKAAAIKGKGKLRMEADVSLAFMHIVPQLTVTEFFFKDDYSSRAGAFEADDYDDFM